ncbi:MAG TPA: zf-HC2 domain-containing protein, partial [Gemmatimonadales bacterium]|nr:zf-HC2 domain-containing protein [Gemmatimonadales bacterium]
MTDRKTDAHLDEGRVHAWLDGELSAAESAAADRHVAACEQCAALVAEARGLIAASSRILSALDDDRSGVTPDADASVAAFAGVLARHRKGDDAEAPTAPNEHREGSEALGAAVPVERGRQSAAADSGTVIPIQTRRRRSILHDPRWRVAATVLVLAGASALVLTRGEVSSVM